MNVVKPEGGNWLSGSVEQALSSLKIKTATNSDPAVTLAELRKKFPPEEIEKVTKTVPNFAANIANNFADLERQVALNKWVDSNLTGYVKKKMGTPSDPVRKLAEEGISHLHPNTAQSRYMDDVIDRREKTGFTLEQGTSPQAKVWESLADSAIRPKQLGETIRSNNPGGKTMRDLITVHPSGEWAKKAPDTQTVNELRLPGTTTTEQIAPTLGFYHIMDVLRQDVTEGRIRPEQLSKVSMEQAVQRTHEFDQEMAKRMREAALKATEGMPIHKDYGEEGYRWVELAPDKNLPEGWKKQESGLYTGPNGEQSIYHPNYSKLSEALKYEGDTMGHCVGSYCPDVWEGKSRIYSLRDAKNEPHITVETEPQAVEEFGEMRGWPKERRFEFSQAMREWQQKHPYAGNEETGELTNEEIIQALLAKGIKPPESILQIKGKQNAPPVDKYLPYAQDFVKSRKWENVEDLENTGLFPKNKFVDTFSPEQIKELNAAYPSDYMTMDELEKFRNSKPKIDPNALGMKDGGRLMAELQSKMQQFRRELVH
jgi:hypothetical protein